MTGPLRAIIATAVAGVFAFCAAASFDWTWQIGVIPMVTMLLAATTLVSEHQHVGQAVKMIPPAPRASWTRGRRLLPRLILPPAAVLALILIAIPLASTIEVYASQAAARQGHLRQALADANSAQAIEPGAASPYLQQALVLEHANDIPAASEAKRARDSPRTGQLPALDDRVTNRGRGRSATRALSRTYQRALVLWPAFLHRSLDEHAWSTCISSEHASDPRCTAVLAGVLISPQADAAKPTKMYLPPGKAGASQYGEDIPTAGGNGLSPAETGGNKTAAQISRLGAGKLGIRKLAKRGKTGVAAAKFAQQTAPTVSSGPSKPIARHGEVLTASGGSAMSGLGHLIDGSDANGIGVLLPLLLALSVVGAVVLGLFRLRRPE